MRIDTTTTDTSGEYTIPEVVRLMDISAAYEMDLQAGCMARIAIEKAVLAATKFYGCEPQTRYKTFFERTEQLVRHGRLKRFDRRIFLRAHKLGCKCCHGERIDWLEMHFLLEAAKEAVALFRFLDGARG